MIIVVDSRFSVEPDIYATAMDLAIRCRHHLFDTLYTRWLLTPPEPHW